MNASGGGIGNQKEARVNMPAASFWSKIPKLPLAGRTTPDPGAGVDTPAPPVSYQAEIQEGNS